MQDSSLDKGKLIYNLAVKLFPIGRSLTGEGVRKTLAYLRDLLPTLEVHDLPSGMTVFDWKIPKEWRVHDAYIVTPDGERICDIKEHNLHLVGYSIPFRGLLTLAELKKHLYTIEEQPDAIPYVTSYYKERWGFCIPYNQLQTLSDGLYEVVVDTELFDGFLSYGELIIKGKSAKEIFISTYICHPSMANNELSGPCVATYLAKDILDRKENYYTYRFVFVPETIGSIAYLSQHLETLKRNVVAGFNVSCIGDNRAYSYLPSRKGDTLSDQAAQHVLKHMDANYVRYTWNDRGSDERQYCAPGIDLPIASIMRTKFGKYPEYHTSLDDLENVVTPGGLEGGYIALQAAISAIENNVFPKVKVLGEPQLGRRGLYPTLSSKGHCEDVRLMMNLITWSDGTKSLMDIAELCGVPVWELYELLDLLYGHEIIDIGRNPH